MGMNMVTKGVEKALQFLENEFPDMDCLRLLQRTTFGFSIDFLF